MEPFVMLLILAAFLCSLVAGFLVAFALVALPGIGSLTDREFIRAFQRMDLIIQNRNPAFMAMWLGSVVALLAASALAWSNLDVAGRGLLIASASSYLLGVQLPTMAINIPLNDEIQEVNADALDAPTLRDARQRFEPRWTRWNAIRTVFACAASAMLIVLTALS